MSCTTLFISNELLRFKLVKQWEKLKQVTFKGSYLKKKHFTGFALPLFGNKIRNSFSKIFFGLDQQKTII